MPAPKYPKRRDLIHKVRRVVEHQRRDDVSLALAPASGSGGVAGATAWISVDQGNPSDLTIHWDSVFEDDIGITVDPGTGAISVPQPGWYQATALLNASGSDTSVALGRVLFSDADGFKRRAQEQAPFAGGSAIFSVPMPPVKVVDPASCIWETFVSAQPSGGGPTDAITAAGFSARPADGGPRHDTTQIAIVRIG